MTKQTSCCQAIWSMLLSLLTQRVPLVSMGMMSRLTHCFSFKDQSLLPRHQTNWSLHSNMNYATTHHLCLIHLSCSDKRTSQALLMPYGVLLDLTSQQTSHVMAVDMPWMVGHSFNASHGLAGLHTNASSISTLNM